VRDHRDHKDHKDGIVTDHAQPEALRGLKVIDIATLFAGPGIATTLGDFGADVIKVDHPRGDDIRRMGWQKDGHSLWSLLVSRNKRSVTLNLSTESGQEMLKQLIADADVLVENFRTGTLERWNLSPDILHSINPGLVIVRTTGFGQTGPYARQAGFGTAAEAMSGFAFSNGYPDGPPTLPPSALADAVAGITGTYAVMIALWWRDHNGGTGQVIDLSLFEPLFSILGIQVPVFDQLGVIQERIGSALPFSAPRNVYRANDGKWLAISGTSQSVAERIMHLIGRPEITQEAWFRDQPGRLAHAAELDEAIQAWVGQHSSEEVLTAFREGNAVVAPIYSVADCSVDPQYVAREVIISVDHPDLGPVRVPSPVPRLSKTPGRIKHLGPDLGANNEEVLMGDLGLTREAFEQLQEEAVAGSAPVPENKEGTEKWA
jgi:crotonobetainyl-CoA:carnitine CoA-transferase CaiB-like acyl-CoA transferase